MEKHLSNNSFEIYFDSEKMILMILWLPDNCSLSEIEYFDNWFAISRYVDVLKPMYLLIDSYELAYRQLSKVNEIFNYISIEELHVLENKSFKVELLQQGCDLFIFSCYTGLAYIDVMRLTSDNISIGIDGSYWLFTERKKTNEKVRVPLLSNTLEIIEKYKNHPTVLHKGALLPRLSNQKLNAYLKEVADLSEINKNLTFHLARHTFATTVTLANGVPIETVSKLLGHSSIKTTQIYAKVIERKVSEDMNLLKEKLNRNSAKKVINY